MMHILLCIIRVYQRINVIFLPHLFPEAFVFSQLLNIPKLSFGKLRASYAQTSGEPGSAYQTATYYSVGNSINGTPTGSFSGTLPNLFLKPFTVTEVEIGTELKFFQNRLGLILPGIPARRRMKS